MVGLLLCLMLCAICWLFLWVFELNKKVSMLVNLLDSESKLMKMLLDNDKDFRKIAEGLSDVFEGHLNAYHGYSDGKETEETNND